jgi:hypothetical protein
VHGFLTELQSNQIEQPDRWGCLGASWSASAAVATKQPERFGRYLVVALHRRSRLMPTTNNRIPGEVAERSKAPVQRTGSRKGTEGSNPSFTAERNLTGALPIFDNHRAVPRRWVGRRMTDRNGPTSPAPHPRSAAAARRSGAPVVFDETGAPDA